MLVFELNEQMVDVIGKALSEAPYKIAAPVLTELQKQINEQQDKKAADKPTD